MSTDLGWAMVATAVVALVVMGISAMAASDVESWTKDERGCYLHVDKDRRVWWSNVDSHTTRRTYCPGVTR